MPELNINIQDWKGIAVYIDQTEGAVHPVSLELIGKAKELSAQENWPVYALMIGDGLESLACEISASYGIKVYLCEHPALRRFLPEPYCNVFAEFIHMVKPSSILAGATVIGRSLAPKIAARFGTGLTADCTALEIEENGGLVQIRPAFGGNIMARIITPAHRPQMATVRYKIFDTPEKINGVPSVTRFSIDESLLKSRVTSVSYVKKGKKPDISDAEVVVALGRAFKSQKELALAERFAELLSAELACTRPLIEAGLFDPTRQIGLSGRTVKPKLIVTLGVSGAVQFKAGMQNADVIFAVNSDPSAPIFDAAHYAVIGDVFEILPIFIKQTESRESHV
ncbi:MAG: electron transfer flavoprotein subunit alpha/FixB family protein [Defluviitaleaceae bacterium]|nr:electron transfer flavoprotein subunit alpha/FixB family protein [Defluviitaleaceae bacterium]MCL2835606.1 electron transfer flavoprotein subunit alpha/FixB family protein [Defluviitaleaceae bacterium]